jgi:hypothetical protein
VRIAGALALAALLLSVSATEVRADRLKVCTFSFHGSEEVAAFESSLPSQDFEFVELTPPPPLAQAGAAFGPDAPPGAEAGDPGWLSAVCPSDLECDVVVFSAEFAGKFFGRLGGSLSLQQMEEASCQQRCDGLFHAPEEVFLLACNTLATKDEDMRTPEVYLRVLLDHGFDQASAERVVATRYGALGPTFREAVRRIFMGVPRVYGFSSVAPTGRYSGPMLDRYFGSVGDYRRHLDDLRRDRRPNRALAAAFGGTSFVETSGLRSSEPAVADRDLVCALYDEGRPVARRLEIVRGLMDRSDLLSFVPSLQVFVDRHPPEHMQGEELRLFESIRASAAARERILALLSRLEVSALKLELGHFAVHMGWMAPGQFRALALDAARELLRRRLTSSVVDVMCEVAKHESVGDEFVSSDLPEALFGHAEGIRLVSCLAPPGDAVSERLAAALDGKDPPLRAWAAHALTRRLPLPDRVLRTAIAHLHDPSPGVGERLSWIFKAQRPLSSDVRSALEAEAPEVAAQAPGAAPRGSWFW